MAIASAPSLAAAARNLNVSASAVTQRLRALEARLRMHLVDRSGRRLVLTGEGELLAEQGRDVLAALGALDDALAERHGEVSGTLRVVAPFGFGRRYVAPVAAAFRLKHHQVRVDLRLSDRLGRVPPDAWDVAVHVGEIANATPSLSVRTLAPNERFVCAAPSYTAGHGLPRSPSDLRRHTCIALRENDEDVTLWRFRSAGGVEERIRIEADLVSNDGEVVRGWALAGLGVMVRSEWDLADDLRAGGLVRLLDRYALSPAPVVALLGARPQARAARTQRFLDALAQALNPPPWRRPDAP